MGRILSPAFYDRDPSLVAPELLGKYLIRTLQDGSVLEGRITETEAYLPFDDPASHGFKRTKTRDSLYLRGGHAYVYALRHHFLFNAVCESAKRPGGVLVRSVVPILGIDKMLAMRGKDSLKDLTNGPGKICQAFAIDRTLDGIDLTKKHSPIYIEDRGEVIDPSSIVITPRIGITKATDKLLRFLIPL